LTEVESALGDVFLATCARPYAADPKSKSAIAVAQARSNFVASPFLPSGARGVLLGTVQVPLAACLWKAGQGHPFPAAKWYNVEALVAHGVGSRVRLQCVLIQAPPKESPGRKLNVLIGTWNVGNEPPPADLTEWLDVGVGGAGSDKGVAGGLGTKAGGSSRTSTRPTLNRRTQSALLYEYERSPWR